MTEQKPTGSEITNVWDSYVGDPTELRPLTLQDKVAFAHAVLAKWGTPAPVGVEPFAWTDDGSTRSGATATSHRVVTNETKKSMPAAAAVSFTVPLYTAEGLAMGRVPLTEQTIDAMWRDHWDGFVSFAEAEVIVRATEETHGIKGGQHA